MFSTARILIYLIGTASLLAGLTMLYYSWQHHERMIGWNGAVEKVANQNAAAKKIADQVTLDVDACLNKGGNWNVATGSCDK